MQSRRSLSAGGLAMAAAREAVGLAAALLYLLARLLSWVMGPR